MEAPNLLDERDDAFYMKLALQQAQRAFDVDEVPVGAIIVKGTDVIAKAYNQRETLQDPTAHAEILAITQASERLESWRLIDCTLYVTLEPCPMCAGALVQSRVPRVVFGASDPKGGAGGTCMNILQHDSLNHRCEVIPGILEEPCSLILKDFFRSKRS